jgi:hypothetical protein
MATLTPPDKPRSFQDHEDETLDSTSRLYSPAEVGKIWGVSVDTVRRLFEKEPGILLIGRPSRSGSSKIA